MNFTGTNKQPRNVDDRGDFFLRVAKVLVTNKFAPASRNEGSNNDVSFTKAKAKAVFVGVCCCQCRSTVSQSLHLGMLTK